MNGSRLAAALVASTVLAATAWLVVSGSRGEDAAGASTGSSVATQPPSAVPTSAPAAPDSGRANVARPAASQVDAGRPVSLTLPSGRTVSIDASATGRDGVLEIPADVRRAGWWDGSSRLGDPFGSVVVAAHVDSFTQGLGRFAEVLGMRPGDIITVRSRHLAQRFTVTSAHLVPKAEVNATSSLYAATGPPKLVLLTCGGDYDRATGYADNMVVVAAPASPPAPR